MNQKAKYNQEDVYIKYMSSDMKTALVSRSRQGKMLMFKVDFSELEGLTKRELNKLKKLYGDGD